MSEIVEEKPVISELAVTVASPVGLLGRLQTLVVSQKRNLQNLSALVVLNFLSAGLFFATQIKIANVIGREQFGLLAYGIALGMYGQTIVRYGMDRTLVRDLIHYPERFSELVLASLFLRGILLALVVPGLLAWKLIWQPVDLSWPVIVIVLAYSLKSLDLQPVYDAWHRMARHAVYNAIQRGLYFIMIWAVIFVAPKSLNLAWIALAYLATELFYLVLQLRWAQTRITLLWSKASWTAMVTDLLGNNFYVWLATIGALSFGALSQILLKKYSGVHELGGYAAGWQITAAVTLLLLQIGRVGKPAMARATVGNGSHSKWFLLKYLALMLGTVLPICLTLWLIPDVVLRICFRPEYADSENVLRVFAIYLLVFAAGIVASQYIVAMRMGKAYLACVLVGSAVGVGLFTTMIPVYQGLGAAIALTIAYGVSTLLYWGAVLRKSRKRTNRG